MFNAKLSVLRRFFSFVEEFVPREQAFFATLGGEGLEAALWRELGVSPDQGWLIERTRQKSRRLIVRFDYRFCSRLDSFARVFTSVRGVNRGVDGFHLDLCGTFEPNGAVFGPVIPLISRSKGKCLAVTVADQRRNLSLEDFGKVLLEAEEMLEPKESERFFGELEAEHRLLPEVAGIGHHADPELGAKREFAFAMQLIRSLVEHRAPRIERIERYHYVSLLPRPFRMRTYFFRFAEGQGRRFALRSYTTEALKVWNRSPLAYVSEGGLVAIATTLATTTKEKRIMATKNLEYPQLEGLARAAGGDCLAQFESLVSEAALGRRVREVFQNGNGSGVPAIATPAAVSATFEPEVAVKGTLSVQLELLRAASLGPEVYFAKVKQLDTRKHGFGGKNGKRRLGALYARTQGKFRADFLGRVRAQLGMESFGELAVLYSNIGGVHIDRDTLAAEASKSLDK